MRITWQCGLLLLLVLISHTPAIAVKEPIAPSICVTAYGEVDAAAANAKEKAIADALRNALMAGVGAYVDASTLGENYQVIRDEVLVSLSGFATLDAVESTSLTNGILRVGIRASVRSTPLLEKLRKLGLTHEWKVGVYLPETYISTPRPSTDPACETEIVKQLMNAGFRVIDESQRMRLKKSDLCKRAAEGNATALATISREYDVDIIITGKAFAEPVDSLDMGGVTFYRCRGHIEARAFYADTGEILSITNIEADGRDQTKTLSSKQCFRNLGHRASEKLVQDLLVAPASLQPFVVLKIANLNGIKAAQETEDFVRSLSGVTKVKRSRYTNGVLELDVWVKSEYLEELPGLLESSTIADKLKLVIDLWSKAYIQGRARTL